jgi:PBP1b-binding outer membrane lipoprotein LpoB
MMRKERIFIMLLLSFLFVGCAADGDRREESITPQFKDVKTVSVLTFACPDPQIAQEVRNDIINTLLISYSVVLGEDADAVVSGTITLTEDSPQKSISAVTAHIAKNRMIVDSVTVTGSKENSSVSMGQKTGIKIKNLMSR